MLTAKTPVYVTTRDATTEMSFLDLWNAIRGGLELNGVEITTNPDESKRLERKQAARQEVEHLMSNMTCWQAEKTVELLRGNDELMELHDDYA